MLLRFADGRPIGALTIQFLAWCGDTLAARGTTALLRVWANAAWHISKEVRAWLRAHNRAVKAAGTGVRIVACRLPVKRPWRNPIEPKWVHGKRRAVETRPHPHRPRNRRAGLRRPGLRLRGASRPPTPGRLIMH